VPENCTTGPGANSPRSYRQSRSRAEHRSCTQRAGSRGAAVGAAPLPVPRGALLRSGPTPSAVCGPGPSRCFIAPGYLSVGRSWPFCALPRAAPGRHLPPGVSGPCGPAARVGAGRPPAGCSLAGPPASPGVWPPALCAARAALCGPFGGFRAGGLVPARPLFRCRGRLAAAVGGAVCGPAYPGACGPGAASAPAAPAPPPGRGWGRAFFRGGRGGGLLGVRPLRRGCSRSALLGLAGPCSGSASLPPERPCFAAPRRAAAARVGTLSPRRPPVRRPPPGALVGAQGWLFQSVLSD